MHRIFSWIIALMGFASLSGSAAADPETTQPRPMDKWEKHYYDRVALFEKENAAAKGIVMVGSSHVEGFNADRLLPGRRVINRGIAADRIGITDRGVLHRLDCSVFDCNPEMVILENGANDLGELWRHGTPSIDEIDACYRKVVHRIRSRLPDVPLVIVGLFPTRDKYAELVPHIVEFNRRLARIAADFDCPFMDVYTPFADADGLLRKEFSREGLHLTEAGYQQWAELTEQVLVQLERSKRPQKAAPASNPPVAPTSNSSHDVPSPESATVWHDAEEFVIEGKGWDDTERFYARLPTHAKGVVPEVVWSLGKQTAGLAVRFVTDSTRIEAAWDGGGAMNHMAATGNSGLDLYARRGGAWVFYGVGRPQTKRTTAVLAQGLVKESSEYLLYLPLYHDVTELKIGIEPGATIAPARADDRGRPIVFYGTSITQGGCASRSGMCHAAILGRWLDREVINLGFSGSGKMEPALAELLAELDPAVYVLECLPNMTTAMVNERVEPFVLTLRRHRPDVPVLLVESPLRVNNNPGNRALRVAFDALTARGIRHLHYLPGADQLAGRENGTVDGTHPTDLGFYRMAVAYRPVLEKILTPGHQ